MGRPPVVTSSSPRWPWSTRRPPCCSRTGTVMRFCAGFHKQHTFECSRHQNYTIISTSEGITKLNLSQVEECCCAMGAGAVCLNCAPLSCCDVHHVVLLFRVLGSHPRPLQTKWARVHRGCPAGARTCAAESRMTLQSERQLVRACVALRRWRGCLVDVWSASEVSVYECIPAVIQKKTYFLKK